MASPNIGEQKKGNLAFLRVHKFKMNKQLTLLGYSFDDGSLVLELMALGSHENFYRDIKRNKLRCNASNKRRPDRSRLLTVHCHSIFRSLCD